MSLELERLSRLRQLRVREAEEKRLFEKVALVAEELGTCREMRHGRLCEYVGALRVTFDDYGLNVDVYAGGRWVLSYRLGELERYKRGAWEEILGELYAEALKRREARARSLEERRLLEELEKWGEA